MELRRFGMKWLWPISTHYPGETEESNVSHN